MLKATDQESSPRAIPGFSDLCGCAFLLKRTQGIPVSYGRFIVIRKMAVIIIVRRRYSRLFEERQKPRGTAPTTTNTATRLKSHNQVEEVLVQYEEEQLHRSLYLNKSTVTIRADARCRTRV